MPPKLKKLEEILKLVDESLTKEEFIRNFEAVVKYVKAIGDRTEKELTRIEGGLSEKVDNTLAEVKADNDYEVSKIKTDALALVKAKIAEISKAQAELVASVEEKLMEVRDGRDADEQAIIDAVLSRVPPQIEETPEILRDKLESLEGEERLDKSAIKGIDEALETLASSGKVTLQAGLGRKVQIWNNGTKIDKNTGIFNFKGTAVTSITRSKDGIVTLTLDGGVGGGYWTRTDTTLTPTTSGDAIVASAHEATGLVAQVGNMMYGAIGDRPAANTVPEGTVYYVIP